MQHASLYVTTVFRFSLPCLMTVYRPQVVELKSLPKVFFQRAPCKEPVVQTCFIFPFGVSLLLG